MDDEPKVQHRNYGAPPPGPIMCFACVTATCRHPRCEGMNPALTYYQGTALCFDCASATVDGLRKLD